MSRNSLSTLLLLAAPAVSLLGLAGTPGCSGKAAVGPAASPRGAGPTGERPESPGSPEPPRGWSTYVEPTHGFSIGQPREFVAQRQDASRLARFTPAPLVSIFFMNPTMAAGALAGIEPPDLEVRVYRGETAQSLEGWLVAAGFASRESVTAAQPVRCAGERGLKVCQSTMVAPGCSIYLLRGGRVYQLTAISVEGEAMIETFSLSPGR